MKNVIKTIQQKYSGSTESRSIHLSAPVGSATVGWMTQQVLSENAQHEIEEHVVAQNEEPPVDALQMDAKQSTAQVEDRKASQV